MSGICGLFNLDGSPFADRELRAMTAMLERRGPERTGQWLEGSTGLGHTLLGTTPELCRERQPFKHDGTGCVITADVRLDNRDELFKTLGLRRQPDAVGDAELILLAYLEWGETCLDRLLGDFAFALWDPRERRLFCARDHFGMRPLYYHHAAGQRFLFASDPRAILVVPDVPYRLDKGRIADALISELEWIDYTSTFYEDIYRLAPGHKLTARTARLEVAEYWRPAPGPDPGPMSDGDWEEGFLEVLTQAVDSRLRAPRGAIASMLSGGMDSGSVVAIGKDILESRGEGPLATISASKRDISDCAESSAIRAAVSMPGIAPELVYLDRVPDDTDELLSGFEEPFDAEMMILRNIFLRAHECGKRVVLDGGAGDIVLGTGSYIMRLIRSGQIRLAVHEILAESRYWGSASPRRDLLHYAGSAIFPAVLKRKIRERRNKRWGRQHIEASLISHELAAAVSIEDRIDRMWQTLSGGWTDDYAVERSNAIRPYVTAGRERYARIAAAVATEARDPFLDRRVVEYCAWLPGRFRLKDGWPKWILRDIMAGRLPDEVRWCRGKPHLGSQFNAAVTKEAVKRGELDADMLQNELRGYVDPHVLTREWERYSKGGDPAVIHTAHVLAVWLRSSGNRPLADH